MLIPFTFTFTFRSADSLSTFYLHSDLNFMVDPRCMWNAHTPRSSTTIASSVNQTATQKVNSCVGRYAPKKVCTVTYMQLPMTRYVTSARALAPVGISSTGKFSEFLPRCYVR